MSEEMHKTLAVNCFNATWDLLDKKERTSQEDIDMIHTAHCSRYHWGQIGTELEFQRGEWQISRVYAVLGRGEPALYHAQRCHRGCVDNNIGDFDLAFSLEALARAHHLLGNQAKSDSLKALARKAAENIAEKENKDYFLGELDSIN